MGVPESSQKFKSGWKPSLYPKSTFIRDTTPEKLVGVSYVVPSRVVGLPHVSIRPQLSDAEKTFTANQIDLPEVIWCAILVSGMGREEVQKLHDEYIMHPPFPRTRATIVKEYGSSYNVATRLPVQNVPELVKQGRLVVGHFCLDETTKNVFPMQGTPEHKAQRSNLLLVFKGHVTEDGSHVAECEYFIPRVMWMTMDSQHRANLHDLAQRTARDIGDNWDQKVIRLVTERRALSHEMLELATDQDVTIFHPRGAGVDINLSSTLTVKRTEFFFGKNELPSTYVTYKSIKPETPKNPMTQNLDVEPVGIVRYDGMFHGYELKALEDQCDLLQDDVENKTLQPMTAHHTIFQGGNRRTKYFFSARYLWTAEQMREKECDRAGGLRTDVDTYPAWMQFVIDRLVLVGVVPQDYVNAVALNMYHDGTIGIGLHQDCHSRFERPIITLRLFSPARLTLGGKALGSNAVCIVDLPRGAVLSMEKDSYAADGIKHCVRNCDMVAKSGAMILRHCHNECLAEADAIRQEEAEKTEA